MNQDRRRLCLGFDSSFILFKGGGMSEPLATHDYAAGELMAALEFHPLAAAAVNGVRV